jgi:hypothetical protein
VLSSSPFPLPLVFSVGPALTCFCSLCRVHFTLWFLCAGQTFLFDLFVLTFLFDLFVLTFLFDLFVVTFLFDLFVLPFLFDLFGPTFLFDLFVLTFLFDLFVLTFLFVRFGFTFSSICCSDLSVWCYHAVRLGVVSLASVWCEW